MKPPLLTELAVVIPARDEVATIADIVARVRALGCAALVVDDASGDGTGQAAEAAGAEVLTLPRHLGNLAAIRAGLTWGLDKGHHWLATLDADGQHAPEDLPTLLTAADEDGRTLVIGSCPERSSWMRQMVWALFRQLSGLPVRDMTSGFKIYSRTAARCLCRGPLGLLGYQDVPSLLRFAVRGFSIREVPVTMVPRRNGASRVFSSWGQVALYMVRVTPHCLIHRPRLFFMGLTRPPMLRPAPPADREVG